MARKENQDLQYFCLFFWGGIFPACCLFTLEK